ncbi:hypothetical protein [Candidatus Uabimicrobium amorphum]|uniref:Uncharacterized protein n=1 Tax=Uabimicrobium amorphum TaxID=2596890 RepID=A0A5S9IRC4_UABAM|nr:hypothetical protein [Candidatus Uabimicrobium amorphum]BBM86484.1 hypothetical protein UABAM_04870 [Candidatus Uabimicrobium amorphum]
MSESLVDIENYSHLLFGVIAIQEGLINNLQLLEALEVQREDPEKKIGVIFKDLGYMTMRQVLQILKEQGKFREKEPTRWPYIPNTMLKGLVYFSDKPVLQNVTMKSLLEAQKLFRQYREHKRPKSLAGILIEDMGLTNLQELKKIQNNMVFHARACDTCLRLFSLYNYDVSIKVECPVCPGNALSLDVNTWKKRKEEEEIAQAKFANMLDGSDEDDEVDEAYKPRATMALANFYELLEKNTANQKKDDSASPQLGLGKTMSMPMMKKQGVQGGLGQTMSMPMMQKRAVAKDSKQELKELYENLEEKETKREQNKANKLSKEHKKLKIREGKDTVFVAKKRQGRSKSIQAIAAIAIVMVMVVGLLSMGGSKNTEKQKKLLFKELKEDAPVTAKKSKKTAKLPGDIAQILVSKVTSDIERGGIPSQDHLNRYLKMLFVEQTKYEKSGDFWNLLGRLYLYKIFLDRFDKDLQPRRIDKIKNAAEEAFRMAQKNYDREDHQPTFKLIVANWMPEKHFGIAKEKTLNYNSNRDAARDIRKISSQIRDILELRKIKSY